MEIGREVAISYTTPLDVAILSATAVIAMICLIIATHL
jgi:hypothetical protein